MDLIDGLKAFVATAQTGSFTEAADRLGISNRLTSKYVAQLESRIGARLLQRTTRKVGLTPTGRDLLARAPGLLDELDELLGAVTEESKGLSGMLRISAPVTFGEIYIKDLISRFVAKHPEISIDLRLSDTHVDLASKGFDLAFRIGTPDVASLKVRKLGVIRSHIVASPDYLANNKTPVMPQDLHEHVCIIDSNRANEADWEFESNDEKALVSVQRRLMVNNARVARDWAVAGCGIMFGPSFILDEDIREGRLLPLLDGYRTETHPLSVVYLAGNVVARKVRALIDFAVEDTQNAYLD